MLMQVNRESKMNNDMLTTIEDEQLEVVTGGGIGSTIGGALDRLLSGALSLLGSGISAVGGLLSGIGGLLSGGN